MADSKHYVNDQVHGRMDRQVEQADMCETCQADDVIRPAFGWCESCDESLCETCYKNHCKPKRMRDHKLLTIEKRKNCNQIEQLGNICKKHKGKLLEYFCKGHEELGCSQCFIEKHRKCDEVVCISNVKTLETEEFKYLDNLLSQFDNRLRSNEVTSVRNQALVAEQHGEAIACIEEDGERLKRFIDWLVRKQIEKAEKVKEDKNRRITDNVAANKFLKKKLSTSQEILRAAKGDNNQLFITMKYLQSESALMELFLGDLESKSNIPKYKFALNTQLAGVLENVTSLGILREIEKHNMEEGTGEVLDAFEVKRFQKKASVIYRKTYVGHSDAIQVSTNHDIQLTSVLLYHCRLGTTDVSLSVTEDNNCLIQSKSSQPWSMEEFVEVKLAEKVGVNGITLYSGHWYDIVVTIKGNDSSYGFDGQSEVLSTVEDAIFSFRNSPFSTNDTNVLKGQIAGFRFKLLL